MAGCQRVVSMTRREEEESSDRRARQHDRKSGSAAHQSATSSAAAVPRGSVLARVAAFGALAWRSSSWSPCPARRRLGLHADADFPDASGLVTGDDVLIGPARSGTISSIGLTPDGAARVTMSLDSDAAPMHQGTVARIYENSLSGIASKYVVLEPAPQRRRPRSPPAGRSPRTTPTPRSTSISSSTRFDPLTRAGLSGFIRGEAAPHPGQGAGRPTRRSSTCARRCRARASVTAELTRNEPAFDGLLVQGAQAMQALASRSAAADPADRQHEHRHRRDRRPEPGAAAGADAAARHAAPFDHDLRRAPHDARSARPVRRRLEAGLAAADRSSARALRQLTDGVDPDRRRAHRPDPQPGGQRRPDRAAQADAGAGAARRHRLPGA